ncbi:DUF6115 domain-containing protein [Virgibacillus sediminis]|uniref:DUF6115 domain-containing protein n=1 Tax=Virgibacillus sediminis TaxID=202260 RepID=A0ABV7AAC6_9BACI
MFSLLLILSFMIHAVTLFAIYQLFKRLKEAEAVNTEDISNLLDSYLQQIREENQRLEMELDKRELYQGTHSGTNHEEEVQEDTNGVTDRVMEEKTETSLQSRILLLHKQGYNAEEIAQQLDCGKTEAELVIKLHS